MADFLSLLPLAKQAVDLLTKKGYKVTCAESCTGGLIAAALTSISGSSAVFDFGAVTYSNDMKTKLLGVDPVILQQYGAVSEPTARAMAEGVRRYSSAQFALSVTGIAGPLSDGTNKSVGLIYIGLASAFHDTKVLCLQNHFTENVRENNRYSAVKAALQLLIDQISETGER